MALAAMLAVTACTTAENDAALGGAAGAVVGGLISGDAGGAIVGGVVGAASGVLLGAATRKGDAAIATAAAVSILPLARRDTAEAEPYREPGDSRQPGIALADISSSTGACAIMLPESSCSVGYLFR